MAAIPEDRPERSVMVARCLMIGMALVCFSACSSSSDDPPAETCPVGQQDHDDDGTCEPACAGDSCSDNGTCDDSTGAVVCTCDAGFQDNDDDGICAPACAPDSCSGNGTCDDSSGAVSCDCEAGWGGEDCAAPACGDVDCGEGSCEATAEGLSCACDEGFQDNDGDLSCAPACGETTCSGNGTCDDATGATVCSCSHGWGGDDCGTPDCTGVNCGEGTCDASLERALCSCNPGWQDADGDLECAPACGEATCSGNGSCDHSSGEALCTCDAGWAGDDCATVDCAGIACGDGTCDASGEAVSCVCDEGFQDNDGDLSCASACGVATCSGNGTCDDASGTAVCTCDAAWGGDDCAAPSCDGVSCGAGTCDASGAATVCTCDGGFQDNDGDLSCAPACDADTCSGNGTCEDASGTASCTCGQGWGGAECAAPDCSAIDCGAGGCDASGDQVECRCDLGFQDNDGNLTCAPACDERSCSSNGACDDASGAVVCDCAVGWGGADCGSPDCGGIDCGDGSCDASGDSATCSCDAGFQDNDGDLSCAPACDVETCSGNGTCSDASGPAACSCDLGWGGDDCGNPDCAGVVCGNGSCDASGAVPACDCAEGFQDNDGDLACAAACAPESCSGNGSCDDAGGAVVCTCDPGWGADDCGTVDCAAVACGAGTCDATGELAACNCDSGFQDNDGDLTCEPACGLESCSGNGACEDASGTVSCTCVIGWTGGACETPSCAGIDCGAGSCDDSGAMPVCNCDAGFQDNDMDWVCAPACMAESCSGQGVCDDSSGVAICDCDPRWGGEACIAPDCSEVDCGGRGDCVDTGASVSCICFAGFQDNDDDVVCQPACAPETCSGNGTCDDASGLRSCTCDAGWRGDDCANTSCAGIDCVGDGAGTCDAGGAVARCNCAEGFQDNDGDFTCNEACAPDTCPAGVPCDDSSGAVVCACPLGRSGDDCSVVDCAGIDCAGEGTGTCDDAGPDVSCLCAAGFQDNDGNFTCDAACDAGSCSGQGGCDDSSGAVSCDCDPGFGGAGCAEPDCAEVTCGGAGLCYVSAGAVACLCDPGRQDNDGDLACEAACAPDSCSGNGACDDSAGTVSCDCDPGWGGADCSAPDCAEVDCVGAGTGVCDDSGEAAVCTCEAGFQDNDGNLTCEAECDVDSCAPTQLCDDAGGRPACVCPEGFIGQTCDVALADYRPVFGLDIPIFSNWDTPAQVPYDIDRSAGFSPLYERVAWRLQLDDAWIWVEVDAYAAEPAHYGVPVDVPYQQAVENLRVRTNVDGIAERDDADDGSVEMWSGTYGAAPTGSFDATDTRIGDDVFGSFQVHGGADTLFALNAWSLDETNEMGIGRQPTGNPDWTGTRNAGTYNTRRLDVFLRPTACTPEVCGDFGTCVEDVLGTRCECFPGHGGERCELCEGSQACFGFGSCADLGSGPECLCNLGRGGPNCLDAECTGVDCGGNGTCDDSGDVAVCLCEDGFQDNDGDLVCTATCEPDPCNGNGSCEVVDAATVCHCAPGFEGSDCSYDTGEFLPARSLRIPLSTDFDERADVPYQVDNQALYGQYVPDRVAVALQLDGERVWVEMDAYALDFEALGVPVDIELEQAVTGLTVRSNSSAITEVTLVDGGTIEMWSRGQIAEPGPFDTDDTPDGAEDTFGVLQVHAGDDVLLAYNGWSASGPEDLGIGNSPTGNQDWTGAANAGSYAERRIEFWVKPLAACAPDSCPTGSTCVDMPFGAFCECAAGTVGSRCDRCGLGACSGQGTCDDSTGAPTCTCDAGWGGDDCSLANCEGITCDGDGTGVCDASGPAARCLCDEGFQDDDGDLTCNEACVPGACSGNGTCGHLSGPPSCTCDRGFEGVDCDYDTASFRPLLALDIPTQANWDRRGQVPYVVDEQDVFPGLIQRVAYRLELDDERIWVEMDPFADSNADYGIPVDWIHDGPVRNLFVRSNSPSVAEVSGVDGKVEMWSHGYTQAPGTYDHDDAITGPDAYGSLQVFEGTNVLFAYNRWSAGGFSDLGIGPSDTIHPDWTFKQNANAYSRRQLEVWVLPLTECSPDTCGENGSCVAAGATVTCECDPGYDGARCGRCAPGFDDAAEPGVCVAQCDANTCSGNGSCDDSTGVPVCTCDLGWGTFDCSRPDCAGITCAGEGGGTCDATGEQTECICEAGFQDNDGDFTCNARCVEGQCSGNGRCGDGSGFALCDCDPGFEGRDCATDVSDFVQLYGLSLGVADSYSVAAPPNYEVDASESFDGVPARVALVLQLDGQRVWAEMDPYTVDPAQMGLPLEGVFDGAVSGLRVLTNSPRLEEQAPGDNGSIEIWPNCYNAAPGDFDADDTPLEACAYGSMQVHAAGQTVLALNRWSVGGALDVGIGPRGEAPFDYTSLGNAGDFTTRRFEVWALPAAACSEGLCGAQGVCADDGGQAICTCDNETMGLACERCEEGFDRNDPAALCVAGCGGDCDGLGAAATLPTGTHTLALLGGDTPVHVDGDYDGGGWLLIGRGRNNWRFDDAGRGAAIDVPAMLGTPGAFAPTYYRSAIVQQLIDAAFEGAEVRDLELWLKRAANPEGSEYQNVRWRFVSQRAWTWDFDDALAEVVQVVEASVLGAGGESVGNSRDVIPANNHTRVFTWPWAGHASQDGFSYGDSVSGTSSDETFMWTFALERHALPYTEVYLRVPTCETLVCSDREQCVDEAGFGRCECLGDREGPDCECVAGLQDNDRDGTCVPGCAVDSCPVEGETCSDLSGAVECVVPAGRSCLEIIENDVEALSGVYLIDVDGDEPLPAFPVVCDMTTDGGGWTIVNSITGADSEEPLVSDVEVLAGDPLLFEHYNLNRAQKVWLSAAASETLFLRNNDVWIRADRAPFDAQLETPDASATYPVDFTTSNGTTAPGWMGWSNFGITGGGDFNLSNTVIDGGVDNHQPQRYNHLNSGCRHHYLYSYSASSEDGDAGYDVNTPLGDWSSTVGCAVGEGGRWYSERPFVEPRVGGRAPRRACGHNGAMCRNIKTLYNFEPPATEAEIEASALQFVRKLSGMAKPSEANAAAFELAVEEVAAATRKLFASLETRATPRSREAEAAKAKARGLKREEAMKRRYGAG